MGAVGVGAGLGHQGASCEVFSVQVVAPVEAGVLDGDVPHISDESPMGKALIGRKVGDDIDVVTGDRSARYSVVSIA